MATFQVYEVQEERIARRWAYRVEAASREEAIERIGAGEAEPIDCGTMGEADFSTSGWAAREDGTDDDHEAWEEAAHDMLANL